MRKIIAVFILISFAFTSCLKDEVAEKYVVYRASYAKRSEVLGNIRSAAPTALRKTGKLFLKDNVAFVNEINEGVHIIDYSNPAQPQNKNFISIPGNVDISVKDHYLYADCYTDMVILDIADPFNVKLVKNIKNMFPFRAGTGAAMNDTSVMIVGWQQKDTIIRRKLTENEIQNFWRGGVVLTSASYSSSSSSMGVAGSMSRFALTADRLYTVSDNELKVFNTANAADPVFVKGMNLAASSVETVFPYKDRLFIGSATGMVIYTINNPDQPQYLSGLAHGRACDPVITDGDYAFVTLHSSSLCGGSLNQMEVLDIKNLPSVQFIKTYPFSSPQGLSKDGNILFVCDGMTGLKVLNAANVNAISALKEIKGMNAYDVIATNGLAIVTATDGLYFVDYSDLSNIHLLSKLSIN